MKEIGRFNVTREQLDAIFAEGHNGISVSTMTDKKIVVAGFVVYDNEDGSKSLKFIDTAGRENLGFVCSTGWQEYTDSS